MSEDRCPAPLAKGVPLDCSRHYFSAEYCSPERFASYGYQIRETFRANPREVLEIGPGNGMVSHLLRSAGLNVVTVDIDASLGPDLVASVTSLPFAPESFDVVLCCEVLEHLPYDRFGLALREMWRLACRRVVLSLPDVARHCRVLLNFPGVGNRRLMLPLPRLRMPVQVFDGQHHWEIGKRGYPVKRVLAEMREAGFDVLSTYRVWEHPYHRLFVLAKRQAVEGTGAPADPWDVRPAH